MKIVQKETFRDVSLIACITNNNLVTFCQVDNENLLAVKVKISSNLELSIELALAIAKVKILALDNIDCPNASKRFVNEQNRDMERYLNCSLNYH